MIALARIRSPDRDKAEAMYIKANGDIKLIDIANKLNLPEGTVRGWKNKDKWDNKLNGTLQINTERSKTLRDNPKKERQQLRKLELDETDLTEKQKLFCLYYVKSFNATMAAIKAGYSVDVAHVQGYENLRKPKIAVEIRRLKGQMQEEVFIDAMDVLNKYIKIAFSDINDYISFGRREQQVIGIYGPVTETIGKDDDGKDIKRPLMETVNFVDLKESSMVDGTLISEVGEVKGGFKIKLVDKMKALEMLSKYFDLFPDKFKRQIEEEKLKLAVKKSGDLSQEETQDDGFIDALKNEVGAVWNDIEEGNI